MHPTKAPELCRTPTLLYQYYQDLVGSYMKHTVLNVLNEGRDPSLINKTQLALIPKKKIPNHASVFKLISLCDVVLKIVTKTITNRLNCIMLDVISEIQSAFVPQRLINDNALIAFECFHFMKNKDSGTWIYGTEIRHVKSL